MDDLAVGARGGVAFSRVVAVDRAASRGSETTVVVRATEEAERAAIAARLRIPAVAALAVDWTLRPGPDGTIEAEGALSARVVQDCVVTLDPFEAAVAERFRVVFVPAGGTAAPTAGNDGFDDDPEAPDTIAFDGRAIDLGEASVEQLALALDPFPRKPGAAFTGGADDDGDAPATPFAGLAGRLARRDG